MQPITAGYWLLVAIGVFGELNPFTGGGRRQQGGIYLSICTSVAILLVWGFWPALLAQTAASVVAALRSRLRPRAAALLVARSVAATAAAAAVVEISGFGTIRGVEGVNRDLLFDLLAIIIVWLVAYHGIAIVAGLRNETWQTIVRRGLPAEVLASASLLFLAPVVVAEPRGWTFALLALPLLALNRLSGVINRQATSLRRDELTGLPNQRGLDDVAAELGRPRRRQPGRYALLLVRVNRLRDLDDAFGRRIVDAVVAHVAARLAAAFGGSATVGRPDSDDFVVLVPRTTEAGAPTPGRTRAAVATINQAVAERVIIDGLPYDATATIGIARSPEDAQGLPALLRYADYAIRFSRPGPDRVVVFTPTPEEELDQRLALLTDLSAALRGEPGGGIVEFVYQPQVRLDSGRIEAVEALLRWTHPERGAVSPAEVFSVAEPTPIVHDLTRLAIDSVIGQLRRWDELGIHLCASVNVSVRDLQQDWFVDQILDRMATIGVAANQLVVEVTETEVISDLELVIRSVDRLATAGLQVAVDDFGSGFASLQYLRQLRLDQLKIDKGLVGSIDANRDDRAVVRSVIELSQTLGLTVVAEGVENREVHQTLRQLGCPMGQGWFYGRPTTATEITRVLAAQPHRVRRRHPRGVRSTRTA